MKQISILSIVIVFSSVAEFLLDYMKEEDFPDLTNLQDCECEIVDKWDDTEGV